MRFAGIMENDFTDGIGICVSFWTQGCPYHCNGCQNPQTWDFNGGSELPDNYIDIIIKLLHKRFKHNLSILGGEPLCQQNNQIVFNLLKAVKEFDNTIKTYVWTGNIFENLMKENNSCLQYIDVLIDGQFDLNHRDTTLWLRGSPNQRIIDVQNSLKENRIIQITREGVK